jgi:hypothetical protein
MNTDTRKQQLRDAQRRRREKLADGQRGQVNLFLTQQSKDFLDAWSQEFLTDKHVIVNALILEFSKTPNITALGFELFNQPSLSVDE